MSRTFKSFSSEAQAHLAQGLLLSRGIKSTVHRFSRYRSIASGGWLLKIAPADFARAQKVLEESDTEVDMDEYVDKEDTSYRRCPKCGSVNVQGHPLPGSLKLIAIVGLGIPLLFISRDWTCKKCQHAWRGR